MQLERIRERARKGHAAEETKKRLIEAGVELFGRYSFDGVSTRNLADRAKVNLASIQYYFGSKEGLYLAVARHIVERVRSWISPQISETNRILTDENPDKETCFRLLCKFLDRIVTHVLGEPESRRWMGICMREQVEPTGAFDILYDGIMEPIHHCLCRLTARMLDLPEHDTETKVRSYAVASPVLMFHISRAEIVRTLNWNDYGTDEIEAIRQVVLEHSRAIFGMPRRLLKAHFAANTK
jgi:TetR/AcrR family transcriptional regulator, regulator of cefoperazone and chloramphenicol sensitivity